MPIKHNKITLQKHKELGQKIKVIQNLQNEIYAELVTNFGKTSKTTKSMKNFINKLSDVQNQLESELVRITTREEWDKENCHQIYY